MNFLNRSEKCVKYLLFIFNLFFVMTGFSLLVTGLVIRFNFMEYEHFLDENYFSISTLFIATGSIIYFIAFFGCCGAVKENFCMLFTFSCLLFVIFLMELAAGVSGYVLKGRTIEVLESSLKESIDNYNKPDFNETTILWDDVQTNFDCCGIHKPTDWLVEATGLKLPMSCCAPESGAIGETTCTIVSPNIRTEGCLDKLRDYIEGHALTLGGVGIGIAVIQALGIFLACYLSRRIKKRYDLDI